MKNLSDIDIIRFEDILKNLSLLSKKRRPKIKNFDLLKMKLIREIQTHSDSISSLCLTKEGRLAASSQDSIIRIYNLYTYKCEELLRSHTMGVYHISRLNNCDLVSSSEDATIKIWNVNNNKYTCIQTLKGHKICVFKTIQLSNNRLGSCSSDKTIKIWSSNPPFNSLQTLTGHTDWIQSIIELRNEELIVSGGDDSKLIFWDNSTYEIKKIVDKVWCSSNNSLIEVENNKLIIGGDEEICIVNWKIFQIETKIKMKTYGYINSTLEVTEDIIICGTEERQFFSFDTKNCLFINLKKEMHSDCIKGIIILNENRIASCSIDGVIKLWKC